MFTYYWQSRPQSTHNTHYPTVKKFINIILQALFVLGTLATTCVAEDETKTPVTPLAEFASAKPMWPMLELAVKLASLPQAKTKLQRICQQPPAIGGFETVFEIEGMHYTCWLYKDGTTHRTEFRVYYHPVGSDNSKIIMDYGADGYLNSTADTSDTNAPYMLHFEKDYNFERARHPNLTHVQNAKTDKEKRIAYDFWRDEYNKVTSDIRAFVYTAEYRRMKPEEGAKTSFIYSPTDRPLVALRQDPSGLFMVELNYDSLYNVIARRQRVLVKE